MVSCLIECVQGTQFDDVLDSDELSPLGTVVNWNGTSEETAQNPLASVCMLDKDLEMTKEEVLLYRARKEAQ